MLLLRLVVLRFLLKMTLSQCLTDVFTEFDKASCFNSYLLLQIVNFCLFTLLRFERLFRPVAWL